MPGVIGGASGSIVAAIIGGACSIMAAVIAAYVSLRIDDTRKTRIHELEQDISRLGRRASDHPTDDQEAPDGR